MPDSSFIDALRAFSAALARDACRIALPLAGRSTVERKDDDSPVTEADRLVQAAIFDAIAQRYPDHAVIGEESIAGPKPHARSGQARYCWVVDPIDGTRNFARGSPLYATSITVLEEGRPVAGAIFDAAAASVYSAGRGIGAYRNDESIRMTDRIVDADTTVLVSSFRKKRVPAFVRQWMDDYNFRNVGSICLHLAWTAAGVAEASYAPECRLWDIAAGALLIEEAGGLATRDDGRPIWPVDVGKYDDDDIPTLCGTPAMHARLLESLRATDRDD